MSEDRARGRRATHCDPQQDHEDEERGTEHVLALGRDLEALREVGRLEDEAGPVALARGGARAGHGGLMSAGTVIGALCSCARAGDGASS